jgi:hypothetical protein
MARSHKTDFRGASCRHLAPTRAAGTGQQPHHCFGVNACDNATPWNAAGVSCDTA